MKDIKISLRNKKTNGEKRPEKDIKNLTEEEKEKGVSIIRNLSRSVEKKLLFNYLTHKKLLFGHFKNLRAIRFVS